MVELPKDPITGKRRQNYVTVHGSKRKADAELTRLLSEVGSSHARSSTTSIDHAIREWLNLVSQNLSPWGEHGTEKCDARARVDDGSLSTRRLSANNAVLLESEPPAIPVSHQARHNRAHVDVALP